MDGAPVNFPDEWSLYSGSDEASSVAVLGNGPSLREIDLRAFGNRPTIGMNAAYRHWDRIGWYPTYYCCLDEVVVESHAEEIARLLTEQRVQGAFLSGRFFEIRPEFCEDGRVLNLDLVSDAWFQRRGKASGRYFAYHDAFVSCSPGMITTGSWAVRWAAFLGFTTAYLFGMDVTYVERVEGSVSLGDYRMCMDETPATNPNYFIADYQREGDEYQQPNPSPAEPNLHSAAFAAVQHDFEIQSVGCRVVNAQPNSGISRHRLFPVRQYEGWL